MAPVPLPASLPAAYREALHLAVELYVRREDADGEMILHAADIFCERLALCPAEVPEARQVLDALRSINQKLEAMMAAQDDVNAAVDAISAFLTDLGNAVTAIQTELANVAPAVDTSALNALVAQLPTVQASVDALGGAQPAPPATA